MFSSAAASAQGVYAQDPVTAKLVCRTAVLLLQGYTEPVCVASSAGVATALAKHFFNNGIE